MQKSIHFSTKFEVVKPLNKDFTLCKCRVMALGKNRNYSFFSKESVDEAMPTLANIPVVAHVYADDKGKLRLGGHDCEIVSEDGTYKFKPTTIPWGVVPESHNAHYEDVVESDGSKATYLVADLILWNRFEDIFKTFYSDDVYANQSMEVDAAEWEALKEDSRYEEIKKFSFSALCLLNKGTSESDPENVTPCFPSSNVQPYKFEFDDNFNKLTEQLKQELSLCFSSATEKGGSTMSKETIDAILKEFSLTMEQLDFEITEEMSEETFREKLKSFTDENADGAESTNDEPTDGDNASDNGAGDEGNNSDGDGEKKDSSETESGEDPADEPKETPNVDDDDDEKPKKKKIHSFAATYKEKRLALENILDPVCVYNDEGDIIESTYFYIVDFDDNYIFVNKIHWVKDDRSSEHGRIKYAFDEKNSTAEKVGEFEKMIVKWLTVAENDEIEAKRAEYEELKSFKAECVEKEHKAECDEILSKFAHLEGNEEFAALKEKAYSFEKDALERECFVILGKNAISKPVKQKTNFSIRIPVQTTPAEKKSKKADAEREFMERFSK